MSAEIQQADPFLLFKKRSQFVTTDLESLPCAVALWTPDRLFCILNYRAKKLLGFSEEDLRKDPSLWINRIHPQDRNRLSTAWERLLAGKKIISSDYRFFPNRDKKEIWLRDVSACCQSPHGEINVMISTYTDISDLKGYRRKAQKEDRGANAAEVIAGLVHEVQNNLQVINIGFDLLRHGQVSPPVCQGLSNSLDRTDKSVQELREYFFPPNTQLSKENPGIILEEVVREMEKELERQGVRVRSVHRSSFPLVWLDLSQFRKVLERVIKFSRALLPHGGVMEIKARRRNIRGQRYVELKVASSSATSLAVQEKDVFRPFLRVNGYQVGLSIELAHQILRRHHGKIFFQKQNPKRGQFTILLKARSD